VLVSSHLLAEVAQTVDDIVIIDGVPSRRSERPGTKIRRSEGVREGRFELPRPFGHRILRLLQPGTDSASTCRRVSSGVVPFRWVSSCREQAVSGMVATHDSSGPLARLRGAESADRDGRG